MVACVSITIKVSFKFGLLTVDPDLRGQNIGQNIITAMERYASARKFKRIRLDYLENFDWLGRYYASIGYERTGKVAEYNGMRLVAMKKEL